jgi:hypothetical protein
MSRPLSESQRRRLAALLADELAAARAEALAAGAASNELDAELERRRSALGALLSAFDQSAPAGPTSGGSTGE